MSDETFEKLRVLSMDREDTTYLTSVQCGNCDYDNQEMRIPKGTAIYQMTCPECGCKTLRRGYR